MRPANVFFPGCQAGAIAPGGGVPRLCRPARAAFRRRGHTARLLRHHLELGRARGALQRDRETLKAELKKTGGPVIIAACPCTRTPSAGASANASLSGTCCMELGLEDAPTAVARPSHDACGARDAPTESGGASLRCAARLRDNRAGVSVDRAPAAATEAGSRATPSPRSRQIHEGALSAARAFSSPTAWAAGTATRVRVGERAHPGAHLFPPPGTRPASRKTQKPSDPEAAAAARHLEGGHAHGPERLQESSTTPVKELMEQRMVLGKRH